MIYLKAFLIGGALCAIGQILIDKTKMTPARILVIYVLAGILLTGVGLYGPLVSWAGAGATVPIIGFGYLLANGVKRSRGGARPARRFNGRRARRGGRHQRVRIFRYLVALVFKPGDKS